jgi:8-oxo-dGTP pyrophosphatase MutT (NUDIX family)
MRYPTFNRFSIGKIKRFCQLNPNYLINENLPQNRHTDITTNTRKASVLIPLCNVNNVPSILFTLRTSNVSTHKNEVSFPGGHINPNESSIEAALRETTEELGNEIGSIEILGTGQTVPSKFGTLVTPVLGFIQDDLEDLGRIHPNESEVQKVFTVSLDYLADPANIVMQELSRNNVRFMAPSYGTGTHRIWGLTGMVLHATLRNVIYPTMSTISS